MSTMNDSINIPFAGVAYSGGPVRSTIGGQTGLWVIDLAGMRFHVDGNGHPLVHQHDEQLPVGEIALLWRADGQLKIRGTLCHRAVILAGGAITREARKGLSVGFKMHASRSIPAGRTVKVNGRLLRGPFELITSSTLEHVGVLPRGADEGAVIHLSLPRSLREGLG